MCCPPGPIGKLWWVVVSCCPRNVGSGASEPKSIDAPRRGWKLEVLGTSRSGLAFPWFPGIFWGIFRDLHVGYGWFSRVYDSVNFEFLDVNSGKKLMITNVLIYIYNSVLASWHTYHYCGRIPHSFCWFNVPTLCWLLFRNSQLSSASFLCYGMAN